VIDFGYHSTLLFPPPVPQTFILSCISLLPAVLLKFSNQAASCIHLWHKQSVSAHWYAIHRHEVAVLHSYPPYLAQILGFWVTCGVKMVSLCHGGGWQRPLAASCIHLRHIRRVWTHWYAIHRHSSSPTQLYPPYFRCVGVGVLGHRWSENWYDVITSLLRPTATSNLLSASILDIYSVYEHINMMFIGI